MASSITTTLSNIVSSMQTLGIFDRVNSVEPKAPPGNGLTAAVFFASAQPATAASGLGSASGLYVFTCRVYSNMLQEPADQIDSQLIRATDAVCDALAGDFDMGATVRNLDIFGAHGTPLLARAGHVDVGGQMYRAIDITIPLIVNDAWAEAP